METINEIKEEYGYTTREAIQDFLELRTVPKIVDNHTHM